MCCVTPTVGRGTPVWCDDRRLTQRSAEYLQRVETSRSPYMRSDWGDRSRTAGDTRPHQKETRAQQLYTAFYIAIAIYIPTTYSRKSTRTPKFHTPPNPSSKTKPFPHRIVSESTAEPIYLVPSRRTVSPARGSRVQNRFIHPTHTAHRTDAGACGSRIPAYISKPAHARQSWEGAAYAYRWRWVCEWPMTWYDGGRTAQDENGARLV